MNGRAEREPVNLDELRDGQLVIVIDWSLVLFGVVVIICAALVKFL